MSCYDLIVGYYVGAASENLIGVGVVSEKYTEVGTVSDYIDIMSDNIDIITDTNDTRTLKTMTTNDKNIPIRASDYIQTLIKMTSLVI